jgi:hypothetical protein
MLAEKLVHKLWAKILAPKSVSFRKPRYTESVPIAMADTTPIEAFNNKLNLVEAFSYGPPAVCVPRRHD